MTIIANLIKISFFVALAFSIGCADEQLLKDTRDMQHKCPPPECSFALDRIDIMPLSEIVTDHQTKERIGIKVYISLLDIYGSQIKSPAVFRFELHEYLQRSADRKGRRIHIWPDKDLNTPAENNEYWKDFFRAYEFDLDFQQPINQRSILNITCIRPDGKRLSAEFIL